MSWWGERSAPHPVIGCDLQEPRLRWGGAGQGSWRWGGLGVAGCQVREPTHWLGDLGPITAAPRGSAPARRQVASEAAEATGDLMPRVPLGQGPVACSLLYFRKLD